MRRINALLAIIVCAGVLAATVALLVSVLRAT